MESQGSIFQTSSDTEVLAHLIKRSMHPVFKEKMKSALNMLNGAYAFLILTEDELICALDPHGFRPLSLGKLGNSYIVASETCAFDIIGAQFVRDIEPGEIVTINDEGVHSDRFTLKTENAFALWNIFILHGLIVICKD